MLNRERNADGLVSPHELLPDNLNTGRTKLLEQAAADTCHFELSTQEFNSVVANSITDLLKSDACGGKYLYLPHGLRVKRDELTNHVNKVKADCRHADDMASRRAIQFQRGVLGGRYTH
jgi:hypothetical protein